MLIVDDHRIMRQGLVGLLKNEDDIRIVGEAEDGEQALEMFEKHHPDVILMDINLGKVSGIELTRIMLQSRPGTAIIGLSMHEEQDMAQTMKNAGAAAYLTKGVASSELLATIRNVYRVASVTPALLPEAEVAL